ncbi:MAG: M1 family metallopeptidase [Kofleriaceae bacterium]
MRRLLVLVAIGCGSKAPPPAPPPPAPPPPIEVPKLRLPKLFVPESYAAKLTIDPAKPEFGGHVEITGKIPSPTRLIWLHGQNLKIASATVNGAALRVTQRDDKLQLEPDATLPAGDAKLVFEYTGAIDAVGGDGMFVQTLEGQPYIYSQFESLDARRVFPCFDEPDVKVPWQVTLAAPKGLVAVANAPLAKESDDGKLHVFEFEPTKPLPSYLIAFGVGPFEIVDAGKSASGTPLRIVVPHGRVDEAKFAAQSLPKMISNLEAWFGTPFPFQKLDLLVKPTEGSWGAVENAGLITVAAQYVLMGPKPAPSQKFKFVDTVTHESAHQWFGDYVTLAWWDDTWLNEGFAQWIEYRLDAQFDPSFKASYVAALRSNALEFDRLTTARRIRQPIETQDEIANAFEGITYVKGASLLSTFEHYVGEAKFQEAVRAYLQARAYGNATSADFVGAVSKVADRDLASAFASLLDQSGVPELKLTVSCEGKPKLTIAQRRFVPAGSKPAEESKPWTLPVCVAYDDHGKRAESCTMLDAPSVDIKLAACPAWVMSNVDGVGYYMTDYTEKQAVALRDRAWSQLEWEEREAAFVDIAVSAQSASREGSTKLPLAIATSLVPKMLEGDRMAVFIAQRFVDAVDAFVAPDQFAKFEAWLKKTYGARANRLGLVAKDTDTLTTEALRSTFVLEAAHGRDPQLVKKAVELAAKWKTVPEAARQLVLTIALDNDPALAAKLVAELKDETDPQQRVTIITALGSANEPRVLATALPLLLDPAFDIHDLWPLLWSYTREGPRAAFEAFYREHKDDIEKRWPAEPNAVKPTLLARMYARACDPKRRDELVTLMEPIKHQVGGERAVAQQTEWLDQCIATRTALEPELRDWLK